MYNNTVFLKKIDHFHAISQKRRYCLHLLLDCCVSVVNSLEIGMSLVPKFCKDFIFLYLISLSGLHKKLNPFFSFYLLCLCGGKWQYSSFEYAINDMVLKRSLFYACNGPFYMRPFGIIKLKPKTISNMHLEI